MSGGGSPLPRQRAPEPQAASRAPESPTSPSRATRPIRIRPPHQATVEDFPDEGEPDGSALPAEGPETMNLPVSAEGPEQRPTTAPAGGPSSSVGSPFTTQATVGSGESVASSQRDGHSPLPQRRFSAGAAAARPGQHPQHVPPPFPQPEVFRYLDPDSPIVTPEAIHHSSFQNHGPIGSFSPSYPPSPPVLSSPSSTPSNSSSLRSDIFPSGRSSGPASSVASRNQGPRGGFGRPTPLQQYAVPFIQTDSTMPNGPNGFHHGWPSPGTPYRGPIPPQSPSHYGRPIQPQPLSPSFQYAPPPHQMVPPITGYEFLTAKLGGSLFSGPRLTPIYRRFDAMSHRNLLEMQLELCGLEDELHVIDELDTKARLSPDNLIVPASARAAANDQTPTGQRRREILESMGTLLEVYHQRLKSFMEIRDMPRPSHNELEAYRQFLSGGPIVEEETGFISATEDHVALVFPDPDFIQLHPSGRGPGRDSQMSTPTPEATSHHASPLSVRSEEGTTVIHHNDGRKGAEPRLAPGAKPKLSTFVGLGLFVALFSPLVGVYLTPDFRGRIFMVFVALGWVVSVVLQSDIGAGSQTGLQPHELVLYAGAYAGAMALVAWTF